MPKTFNGRPAHLGAMYFEKDGNSGATVKKYMITYCECGKKIGLTRGELEDFASNMPGIIPDFIISIFAGLKDIKRLIKY